MRRFIFIFLTISIISAASTDTHVGARKFVVTCSEHDCDSLPELTPNEIFADRAIIYQTSNKPEYMQKYFIEFTDTNNKGWQHIIFDESINPNSHPIIGFGGAFTDSAANLYQHMSERLKKYLIESYFKTNGADYSLGRVPMGSTDFSCRNIGNDKRPAPSLASCDKNLSLYSYADTNDVNLKNFALQPEDLILKIPMIKDAISAVKINHHELLLFASPWSAPAWLKRNNSMIQGSLKPELRQIWANYFVKFLRAYDQQGISFWGITIQNEPAIQNKYLSKKWQSMYFSPEDEADFLQNYLAKVIHQFADAHRTKINIMVHDDQINNIFSRTKIMNDIAGDNIDGIAFHWYINFPYFYSNLDKTNLLLNQKTTAKKFLLSTEACAGYLPIGQGPKLGDFSRAEQYAKDIISDLNHSVSGWTDWNLILDIKGGPNWVNNFVDAPIIFDLQKQIFYKQPMYYYLSHFSKFIRPQSQLVESQSEGPAPLEEVIFKVPKQNHFPALIVVTVLNRDHFSRTYYLENRAKTPKPFLNIKIPAHSLQTIIFKATRG